MNKKLVSLTAVFTLFLSSCGIFGGHGGDGPMGPHDDPYGPHDPYDPHDPHGPGGGDKEEPEVPEEGDTETGYIDYMPCDGIELTFSRMQGRIGDEVQISYEIFDHAKKFCINIVNQRDQIIIDPKNPENQEYRMRFGMERGRNPIEVTVYQEDLDDGGTMERARYIQDPKGRGLFVNNLSHHDLKKIEIDAQGISSYGLDYNLDLRNLDMLPLIPSRIKYLDENSVLANPYGAVFMEHLEKTEDINDNFVNGCDLVLWGVDPHVSTFKDKNATISYFTYDDGQSIAIKKIELENDSEPYYIPREIEKVPVKTILSYAVYITSVDRDIYLPDTIENVMPAAFSTNWTRLNPTLYIPGHDLKPGFRKGFLDNYGMRFYGDDIFYHEVKDNFDNVICKYIKHELPNESFIDIIDLKMDEDVYTIPSTYDGYHVRGIIGPLGVLNMDDGHEHMVQLYIGDGITHIYDGGLARLATYEFYLPDSIQYLGGNFINHIASKLRWPKSIDEMPMRTIHIDDIEIENEEYIKKIGVGAIVNVKLERTFTGVEHIASNAFFQCDINDNFKHPVKYDCNAFVNSKFRVFDFDDEVLNKTYSFFDNCKIDLFICDTDTVFDKYPCDVKIGKILMLNPANKHLSEFYWHELFDFPNIIDESDYRECVKKDDMIYIVWQGSKNVQLFKSYSNARQVVIPETITIKDTVYTIDSIGSNAFEYMFKQDCVISNSIKYISNSAFKNFTGKITIGTGVEIISMSAFECNMFDDFDCKETPLFIPNNVKYIGSQAFKGRELLRFQSETYLPTYAIDAIDDGVACIFGVQPTNQEVK